MPLTDDELRYAAIACDLYADEFPEDIDPDNPARASALLHAASAKLVALYTGDSPKTAEDRRETEHRAERTTGVRWDEDLADFVDFAGIKLWWRFVGERRWQKHTLIPSGDQTVDGLLDKIESIVERMAEKEAERDA